MRLAIKPAATAMDSVVKMPIAFILARLQSNLLARNSVLLKTQFV